MEAQFILTQTLKLFWYVQDAIYCAGGNLLLFNLPSLSDGDQIKADKEGSEGFEYTFQIFNLEGFVNTFQVHDTKAFWI